MSTGVTIIRLFLASIFLMAGWMKLREGSAVVDTVRRFRLLPGPLVKPYGRALPWVELIIASSFFLGIATTIISPLAIILVLNFVVASAHAMRKNLNLRCACFGLLYRERIGLATLARDLAIILLAALVLFFDRGQLSVFELIRRDNRGLSEWLSLFLTFASVAASAWLLRRATSDSSVPSSTSAS